MTASSAKHVQLDARREQRTSLFVMATIYSAAGSAPVKIRDMSSRGALIEGAVIPPAGTEVRICRGSLSVISQVAWSKEGRAGLLFGSTVSVSDWLPGGRRPAHQERVDRMVQEVRALGVAAASPAAAVATGSSQVTALELTELRQAIEALADDLADDPAVLERHASKLQTLDLTAQILRKLAAESK